MKLLKPLIKNELLLYNIIFEDHQIRIKNLIKLKYLFRMALILIQLFKKVRSKNYVKKTSNIESILDNTIKISFPDSLDDTDEMVDIDE
jgi:hypothetical protein